jgi:hypothetical protein
MMSLLFPVDVRTQTLRLLPERLFLFPPDALAAYDHHDRLVAHLEETSLRQARTYVVTAILDPSSPRKKRQDALWTLVTGWKHPNATMATHFASFLYFCQSPPLGKVLKKRIK